MQLKIVRTDGTSNIVDIKPKTEVGFEDAFDMPLSEAKRQKHFYWLAWNAEFLADKADGKVVKLFDDWLEDLASVDAVEEGKGATSGAGRSRSSSRP